MRRHPRAGLRDRWVGHVFRDREISDGCRVLLLYLAERMTDAGRVSTPRDQLAEALGVDPRRITARITEATRAGLLSKRGGGWKGRTAEYEALLPKVAAERLPSPAIGGGSPSTFSVHLYPGKSDSKVDAPQPPNARASVNETRQRDDGHRNDGASRTDAPEQERIDGNPPGDSRLVAAFRESHDEQT